MPESTSLSENRIPKERVKAVTIDFWNTLYDSSNGDGRTHDRHETILRNAARLNAPLEEAAVKAAQKEAWEYFNKVWREEQRTPSTRRMVEYFWQRLALSADEQALQEVTLAFEEGIVKHPPSLLPNVKEVLARLSEKYYLALISDTAFSPGRVLKRVMEADGIAEYFSMMSFSDETGVSKPHAHAYEVALSGTRCQAHECVHIGDIERTDIAGAKEYGMFAILFAGDPHARMNDEHKDLPTQADMRAESWSDIAHILLG
ncbi:MAG: HAD family hydrolase [Candidatus Kapaibacterium sp.]|nr:MAG: HAD family hydrolase [Candidatus Kapabacteria bacterium]